MLIINCLCFFYAQTTFAGDLHLTEEWLSLAHYKKTLLGYESTIDSENFFLSTTGKINPKAELEATIDLFQNQSEEKQCFFPARYRFLKKNKLINKPWPKCKEFESFKKDLSPKGITLIYTDAYMNNPSSLFGHTLMRLDADEKKTQMVAHGMNYGAFVPENENGALFALYGLTGMYWGGFTVKPYYNVINMYNNIENRDIWEFELNLKETEKDFFVEHLWELGHTQTKYYFFTQNCSYILLEVLDAIRPSLKLANEFPVQTIPLDTLKAIYNKGLVKKVTHRPSRKKRLDSLYEQMNKNEKALLVEWINEKTENFEGITEETKARVLEMAYEYTQYQYVKGDIDLKSYRKKLMKTLRLRSNLKVKTENKKIESPSPLNAHESNRIQFSSGINRGKSFFEIAYRPAYHELTDRPEGLLKGAEILFLDTTLRYYNTKKSLKLENLDIIKITSISPRNEIFKPVSWQFHTFIKRELNGKTKKDGLVYTIRGGSGLNYEIYKNLFTYALINTQFSYGGSFMPHNQGISLLTTLGALKYFEKSQLKLEVEKGFSDNDFLNTTKIDAKYTYNIQKNTAIGLNINFEKQKSGCSNSTTKLFFNYFF